MGEKREERRVVALEMARLWKEEPEQWYGLADIAHHVVQCVSILNQKAPYDVASMFC